MGARTHPPRSDDYLEFCEGVRRLTGIDLTPVQAAADGAAHPHVRRAPRRSPRWPATSTLLAADPAQLEQFLDRVTINVSPAVAQPRAVAAAGRDVIPRAGRDRAASAAGAPAAPTAPRPTRSPAICRRPSPRGARVEIHGTDIDARMVERARAGPASRPRTCAARRASSSSAGSRRPRTAAGRRARAAAADAVRDRRPAARPVPRGRLRPRAVPQRRHLLHRGRARRPARAAGRRRAARRLPDDRLQRAGRRTRPRSAWTPSIPSSTGEC